MSQASGSWWSSVSSARDLVAPHDALKTSGVAFVSDYDDDVCVIKLSRSKGGLTLERLTLVSRAKFARPSGRMILLAPRFSLSCV